MEDPKEYAKRIRGTAQVERLLGQFLRLGSTKLNASYDRGWEYAYNRTDHFKSLVNELMEKKHMSFDDAFDMVEHWRTNPNLKVHVAAPDTSRDPIQTELDLRDREK